MNRVIHFEFHSADPKRDMKFFTDIFGWQFHKWEGGGEEIEYWLVSTGPNCTPGINGGLMRSRDGQPRTVNTLSVTNVDEFADKVTSQGGKVVVPKMSIPGVGYVVYCTDPGGQIFGIHQHDPDAK